MPSEIEQLLDQWPTTLQFEVITATVEFGSRGSKIILALRSQRSLLHDRLLRIDEREVRLSDLPFGITLHHSNNDAKFKEIIDAGDESGYVEYFPPVNSGDGVVDEGHTLSAVAVLKPDSFEGAVRLLLDPNLKSRVSIDVKGFSNSGSFDKVWDVQSARQLPIVDAHVFVQRQTQATDHPLTSEHLESLSTEVRQLRELVTKGVRVRLFD